MTSNAHKGYSFTPIQIRNYDARASHKTREVHEELHAETSYHPIDYLISQIKSYDIHMPHDY